MSTFNRVGLECIADLNESQNVTYLVRSPLNFFIVSLGSFTLACAITICVSVGEVSVGVGDLVGGVCVFSGDE